MYLDRPMRYVDRAANLYIDFPAGRLHLSGEEAVKYMRFRHDALGDYARLDRIKAVAIQVARKAQDPRVWPALAAALREVWRELDTDLSLEEVLDYLPYARDFQVALATLPTREGAGTYLYVDEARRGSFLPPFSGGRPSPRPPASRCACGGTPGSSPGAGPSWSGRGWRCGRRRPRWPGAPFTPATRRWAATTRACSTFPSSPPTGPWPRWWWSSGRTCYTKGRWSRPRRR